MNHEEKDLKNYEQLNRIRCPRISASVLVVVPAMFGKKTHPESLRYTGQGGGARIPLISKTLTAFACPQISL